MAIQTNFASSAFESLVKGQTAGQGTASRSDMFASMMDRLIGEAATRKRDQAQAEAAALERRNAAADSSARKAAERAQPSRPEPIRAEPAKPRPPSDPSTQADARAARKEEAQRSADRREARTSGMAQAGEAAHAARTERREAAANHHAVAKGAKDTQAGTAPKDGAAPQTASASAGLAPDGIAAVAPEETDGTESRTAEDADGKVLIVDATVTVTETTVELVTSDQSRTLTGTEAALSLTVAPVALGALDGNTGDGNTEQPVDGAVAAAAPVETAKPGTETPDGEENLAEAATSEAEAGLAAALAVAGAVHQDGKAQVGSADESLMAVGKGEAGAAKPVPDAVPTMVDATLAPAVPADGPPAEAEAKDKTAKAADALALAPGALPIAELPNDDGAPLPQNLTDLAAARTKGAGRTGAEGESGTNAGNRGNQDQNGNAVPMQPPAPQAPVADPAKPAGQSAFLAAAAAAEAAPPVDTHAHSTTTPTHPAFAGIEGVRTASGVEAGLTTAQLRPSRGSAGLPMGVQEQVAVHITKNVSDGNDKFTINLRPAELGRIDIKLEIGQDGRVSASVAVEKAQTLELLQRDSRNLERALQDAGLKADGNSLNFSLRGEGGQSFQDSGRQGGSGRRGRGFGGGTGEVEDAQAAYTLTLAPGRVDIQA